VQVYPLRSVRLQSAESVLAGPSPAKTKSFILIPGGTETDAPIHLSQHVPKALDYCTENKMEDVISQAKAEFIHAKQRIEHSLATTPDDRINWAPSPTARTPIQTIAHAADSVKHIHGMLDGRPFQSASPAEADIAFHEWERQFTTREQVLCVLNENSANYLAWLDTLTSDRLDTMIELPFDLGSAPIRMGLTFPVRHTHEHAAQIEYIQTIYGDLDRHA
jgi:hypothetical protein